VQVVEDQHVWPPSRPCAKVRRHRVEQSEAPFGGVERRTHGLRFTRGCSSLGCGHQEGPGLRR
jgi:hypothetical protein